MKSEIARLDGYERLIPMLYFPRRIEQRMLEGPHPGNARKRIVFRHAMIFYERRIV